jgi:hypothetical protein
MYTDTENIPEYPPMKGIDREVEMGFGGLRLGMRQEEAAAVVGRKPVTSEPQAIDEDIVETIQSYPNGFKVSYYSFQDAEYALSSLTLNNTAYETYQDRFLTGRNMMGNMKQIFAYLIAGCLVLTGCVANQNRSGHTDAAEPSSVESTL